MTLTDKVIGWLSANPNKCINADQISDFFDVHRAKVATQLSVAVGKGALGLSPLGGKDSEPVWYLHGSEWAAANGHSQAGLTAKIASAPQAIREREDAEKLRKEAKQKERLVQRYASYDFTDLEIEDGVPLLDPKKLQPALHKQLYDTFDRMQSGQSVLIPKCSAIRKAAALFNEQEGRHVVTRKVDAEHIRVWRTL